MLFHLMKWMVLLCSDFNFKKVLFHYKHRLLLLCYFLFLEQVCSLSFNF
jgi:hypothetical protein